MPRRKVDRVARVLWVVDGEPQFEFVGPNRGAADVTVAALRELGRLERVDEAAVMTFVTLGDAVDADPTNAALWGQYRAAEEALRGLGIDGKDDPFAQFVAELSAGAGDAAVVESEDARSAGRKGGGRDRAAVHAVADGRRRPRGGTAS